MNGEPGPQGPGGEQGLPGQDGNDAVGPDGGYLAVELDPLFALSPAAAVTSDHVEQ